MKFYVRTTKERKLDQYDFLNPIYLIDTEHKPVKSFIEQLKLINDDDCVFMEDDIIFCENFLNELTKAITAYPNSIINFFYRPMVYMRTSQISGVNFIYNQCVYYPKGITRQIATQLELLLQGENDIEKFAKTYDQLQGKALSNLSLDFISYRPCIVQHIGQKSILGNKGYGNFKTPFFKDDIKGLNYNSTTQMYKRRDDFLDSIGISRITAKIISR